MNLSRQQSVDHRAADVGESIVSALKSIGLPFVIDAEAVQNRCLQIVNMDRICSGLWRCRAMGIDRGSRLRVCDILIALLGLEEFHRQHP